jgi:hypothetical protein
MTIIARISLGGRIRFRVSISDACRIIDKKRTSCIGKTIQFSKSGTHCSEDVWIPKNTSNNEYLRLSTLESQDLLNDRIMKQASLGIQNQVTSSHVETFFPTTLQRRTIIARTR